MKRAAAMAAVMMLGACGGGGATKTTGTDTTTATPAKPDGPPPEPAPEREAVDVATLPAWEGNVDDGKVVVAAAEVDGETLRRALVPPAIEIITVRSDVLVTGRVAGSQVGAL